MKFVFCLFITFFVILPQAFAQSYLDSYYGKPKHFSVDIQYIDYSDILSNSSGIAQDISSTLNVNFNLRIYRTYNLMLIYGKASDWSYMGVGFRADLPGFFCFGGKPTDFVRKKKLRNVNTYIQAAKMMVSEPARDSYVDDRIGLGMDIFLLGDLYFNFEMNLQSHEGNQYVAPAIGIGYEF